MTDEISLNESQSFSNYGGIPIKAEYCHESVQVFFRIKKSIY